MSVDAPVFENASSLRSAALAAMGGGDDAPSTATDTQDAAAPPVEAPAAEETPRDKDGKFLPRKGGGKAVADLDGDKAVEKDEEPAKVEPEPKKAAEKEPSKAEARKDLIALRNQQAALQRRQEAFERDQATLEAKRAEVEARAQRHAQAKTNPIQYLRELAKETGFTFEQLYHSATQEMLGTKEAPLSPQEQAIQDKLAALEEQTKRTQHEIAQRESQLQFREYVSTNADKFPLFAKEPVQERQQAAAKFATSFHSKNGRWPDFPEVAAHFEPLLDQHYKRQADTERAEFERLRAKFSPGESQGASDRGNGAAKAGNPRDRATESPKTLSNGHASQVSVVSGDKPMTTEQRRKAALEMLGKAS